MVYAPHVMDHDRIDNTHIPYIKASMDWVKAQSPKKLNPAPVKLRAWLIKHNMTTAQMAMRTGFSATTIRNILSGQPGMYPSLAQAFAIEYVTKGAVPAWLWLDDSVIRAKVRESNLSAVIRFEGAVKSLMLKYLSLTTADGMLRHKARILSRLFGVEWGEVKRRTWEDAKQSHKELRADVSHLLTDDITEEESDAQDKE